MKQQSLQCNYASLGPIGSLKDYWSAEPLSYLGLAIPNFPNLFTVTGPGSPSVLSNMPVSLEQHVDWITDCISYCMQNGIDKIEADVKAAQDWVLHTREAFKYIKNMFFQKIAPARM